jgi:hypothetical protein
MYLLQPEYRIPLLTMGLFKVKDAVAAEESHYFIREGCRIGNHKDHLRVQDRLNTIDGRIGGGFFCSSKCVCYFDMAKNIFCMGTHLDQITKNYPIKDFIPEKFEMVNGLICINLLTDRGMKKFVLDTGSNRSLIQKSSSDANEVKVDFELFGRRRCIAFDFPAELPFDGILGFDFFDDYPMCLDFSNQILYIKSNH